MTRFAESTQVSAEKSRNEIERILANYGATGFFYSSEPGLALIGFKANARIVKMGLPLPSPDDFKYQPRSTWKLRTQEQKMSAYDQEVRRRWRCLALAIKAKLEVVETGISTFEQEFLAHVLTYDGRTVGEAIIPKLEESYKSGKNVPLLLGAP